MAILACGLLCIMGAADAQGTTPQQQVPGSGAWQQDSSIMSSSSGQQLASSAASPNYDWLSPGGVGSVRYYGWYPSSYYSRYPSYRYWYYPSGWYYPRTTYYWPDYYYNSYDPWWTANIYGPGGYTYYWYSY
jgi:hypothetical protein